MLVNQDAPDHARHQPHVADGAESASLVHRDQRSTLRPTHSSIISPHMGDIVRGKPARFASFDTRPCEVPPDWRGTYRAPWTYQTEEEQRTAAD
jgi:hypothetical protein